MAPVLLRPDVCLLYAETGRNVTLSMVAGKVIYRDGVFTNVDMAEVHTRLLEASERLQSAVEADPMTVELPIVALTREGKM